MSLPPPVKIPPLDNTLGALFIGSSIATILYGVICLQTFLYITSAHSQKDGWWLKSLVFLLFALDSAHQLAMTASIYKFLVSDFLNPASIALGAAGSGQEFVFASACIEAILLVFIQLFFCSRIWVASMPSLRIEYRLLFIGLTVSLALLSFATSMDLAVRGSDHRLWTPDTPGFILAYKLSTSTRVSFDVIVTIAMTICLRRSRSSSGEEDVQYPKTDHVITLLTLFTVNTNLITTCLSISELVTFLTLPNAALYAGIAFLSAKTYLNSFFALLNSRDYLREKLQHSRPPSKILQREEIPMFTIPPAAMASSSFQRSSIDFNSNFKHNTNNSNTYNVNIQVCEEVLISND